MILKAKDIVRAVRAEFGSDAFKVEVNYSINMDGYTVAVYGDEPDGVLKITRTISGLQELQAHDPERMLEDEAVEMHRAFKTERDKKNLIEKKEDE